LHARVPSSKGLHKLTKAHGNDGSHTDLKKLAKGGGSSATTLKKNISQSSLKRNRSAADVTKRIKESQSKDKGVHFEIGDTEQEDWEEASSTASPALSRPASAKASASNSEPQSPVRSHASFRNQPPDGENDKQSARHTADGKIIAERLLQRTPSYNTTKMSLATATPMGHSPDSISKSQDSITLSGTPKNKDGVVSSRFVGAPGTPSSQYFPDHKNGSHDPPKGDDIKRVQSMGNLVRQDSIIDDDDEEEESALAPRSRKSSTSHPYIPSQQSRTQQKLWLQRASSHIEPQPGVALNGIHGGLGGSSLVWGGYDGRDPRIKIQLERTGLEYLVVRRHQDPVGKALQRLDQLTAPDKKRRIPEHSGKKGDGTGVGRHGLSQSLKERERNKGSTPVGSVPRSSFEGAGSHDGIEERGDGDEGVGALLRTLWEKGFDLSASAD
jgi:hypothetical protein